MHAKRVLMASIVGALAVASLSWAQAQDSGVVAAVVWPDTEATRAFRQRVIDLALLYGSSSGIDPNGFKIEARIIDGRERGCALAEVATTFAGAPVRLDRLPACAPHS